jgi:hypothetical protein
MAEPSHDHVELTLGGIPAERIERWRRSRPSAPVMPQPSAGRSR